MVISSDEKHDADVLSVLASSAALVISSIPFNEPVAAVRIGRKDGNYIVNPTKEEQETCDMDLVIAGSAQGLLMVEGGAKEVEEDAIIKAMEVAKPEIDKMCAVQLKLRELAGKPKFEYVVENCRRKWRTSPTANSAKKPKRFCTRFPISKPAIRRLPS